MVNALWAGGAEAMTIMGERVIATTAVRCVGNTLLLHGRVHSPPFTVAAISVSATWSVVSSPAVSRARTSRGPATPVGSGRLDTATETVSAG